MDCLVQCSSSKTLKLMIFIYIIIYYLVCHHKGCTSIYRQLSCPLRSLIIIWIVHFASLKTSLFLFICKYGTLFWWFIMRNWMHTLKEAVLSVFLSIQITLRHFNISSLVGCTTGREGTFDFELHWYPKFYNHVISSLHQKL